MDYHLTPQQLTIDVYTSKYVNNVKDIPPIIKLRHRLCPCMVTVIDYRTINDLIDVERAASKPPTFLHNV